MVTLPRVLEMTVRRSPSKTSPLESWVNATPTPKVVGTQENIAKPILKSLGIKEHERKIGASKVVKKLIEKSPYSNPFA